MKMSLVVVQDIQAQAFLVPMFVQSVGVGVRMVSDEVNRSAQDNVLWNHPEDFRVFHLGHWDNGTGLFECFSQPELVADCSSLRR